MSKLIRMYGLQFHFAELEQVPMRLRRDLPPKPADQRGIRTKRESLVPLTEKCTLESVDMADAGYELVNQYCQLRQDPNVAHARFYLIQFWYCLSQFEAPSDDFKKIRDGLAIDFQEICKRNFWAVQGWVNPAVFEGAIVPDQYSPSLVMNKRKSRYRDDGSPEMYYPDGRDKDNNPIGEMERITADYRLQIGQTGVTLVPIDS